MVLCLNLLQGTNWSDWLESSQGTSLKPFSHSSSSFLISTVSLDVRAGYPEPAVAIWFPPWIFYRSVRTSKDVFIFRPKRSTASLLSNHDPWSVRAMDAWGDSAYGASLKTVAWWLLPLTFWQYWFWLNLSCILLISSSSVFLVLMLVPIKLFYIYLSSSTTPITTTENYVMLGHQFNLKGFIFHKSMLMIINYL